MVYNFRVFRCEDLLDFLNEVESYFSTKLKAHNKSVEKNIRVVNASEEAECMAVDGAYCWGWEMPYVLSASVFTYAYGRLEHCIHALCKLMQEVRKLKCGPEDLCGKGFVRSQHYLEKIIGITWISSEADTLQTIRLYGIIRNSIAHNNGILRQDETTVEDHIRKTDDIELDAARYLELSPQYVHNALIVMSQAWNLVFHRMQQLAGSAAKLNPLVSGAGQI